MFILSFHFRETFQKQPRHGLFPDGENQILGSNIFSHGKRKAQLKDFVELLESPARNFRGGLETEFDKKKVMRIASYHVNKCFRKMNLRLYSSDRPARVFWPQNEGVSNSQRLNVVKLMCIPLTLLGYRIYGIHLKAFDIRDHKICQLG